jgi:hypothetical protein
VPQPVSAAPVREKKVYPVTEKVYKDLEVQFKPQESSKNNLNVIMFGSPGSGKSTICGQFLI